MVQLFVSTRPCRRSKHDFGLGDKPGPLDRRDHAYDLWNTDSYGFQESTDPIYKSIPFLLTSIGGLTTGVLLDNTWRTSFDFGKESPRTYTLLVRTAAHSTTTFFMDLMQKKCCLHTDGLRARLRFHPCGRLDSSNLGSVTFPGRG